MQAKIILLSKLLCYIVIKKLPKNILLWPLRYIKVALFKRLMNLRVLAFELNSKAIEIN